MERGQKPRREVLAEERRAAAEALRRRQDDFNLHLEQYQRALDRYLEAAERERTHLGGHVK